MMLFSSFIKNLLLDILFINFYYCFFIDFHIFKLISQIYGFLFLTSSPFYKDGLELRFARAFHISMGSS